MKYPLLVLGRKPRVAAVGSPSAVGAYRPGFPAAERLGRLVDVSLRGHENEHVARRRFGPLVDRFGDGLLDVLSPVSSSGSTGR